ncbi:MAG: Mur ligase family protein [Thermoleophilaceae bacterium]
MTCASQSSGPTTSASIRANRNGPFERPQSGLLLDALYPLDEKVPGLRRVPLSWRRVTRRTLTAAAVRAHLARCRGVRAVGITGSRGKTTTKELLAAMLATEGRTLKTRKNDNGLYGVPATLLAIRPGDRFAVVEAGVFYMPGEMRWMAGLFSPEVAILTGVGEDHITYYGSRARVAAEKRALLERVGEGGTVVVNADDDCALRTAEGLRAKLVTAGFADSADVRVASVEPRWPEGIRISLDVGGRTLESDVRLFGTHLATAVALAVAAAAACGIDPSRALRAVRSFQPPDGRLRPAPGPGGATWLLDDFKSRTATQSAAIRALADVPARRRIAVLGEVQESDLEAGWRAAAELLPGRADTVIAVGRHADVLAAELGGTPLEHSARAVETFQEATAALRAEELRSGDVVLLQGATRQHLRRIKLLLEKGSVGCRVKRCSLHLLCNECPYLEAGPPESVVEAR